MVAVIYCFDIDNTICKTKDEDYALASPYLDRIDKINKLFAAGNVIKIYTARGSKSGIDWSEFTKHQLDVWQLKYHELHFGKPFADHYIDDKAINDVDFFRSIET